MSTLVAATVALGALVWAHELRRRLACVARAEHELRGGLAGVALAAAAVGRRSGPWARQALEAPLERARAGLDDLHAARHGHVASPPESAVSLERLARGHAAGLRLAAARERRRLKVRWCAGDARVRGDEASLSKLLGNLLGNAVEHGGGDVEVTAERAGGRLRLQVLNGGRSERGMGLGIAGAAARAAGGTLELRRADDGATAAVVELPIAE